MNYQVSQTQFDKAPLPILSIVIAQQCVLFPLYFFVPLWISLLNIICAGMVVWSYKNSNFEPARWLKLLITVAAIGGVFLTFHKISGRDAGVALISVMYGLKILETKKTRDANLLLSLGFFILVSGFLFSKTPWIAIYQLVPVLAILNALVAMNSLAKNIGVSQSSVLRLTDFFVLRKILKSLSKYLLLAIPIMLVLFVFFPRLSSPLWRMPGSSNATTGVSDSMTPGDISSLKLSDEIVFRVQFENQEPSSMQMYWRVLVLDDYNGVTWSRIGTTPIDDPFDQSSTNPLTSETFDYTITSEPTDMNFLVTLDRPVLTPNQGTLLKDFTTYSRNRLVDRTRYSVKSSPDYSIGLKLSEEDRERFSFIPDSGNPKSQRWAKNQRLLVNNDWDFVRYLLQKINQEEYFYTLDPPIMDEDMVDSFWFNHQRGFCEHYSGVLVYLARAAGIPARVVIGYQGGEKNPLANYWMIRSANAHAWTEIWFEGKGWLRVDPTAAIAPHRVETQLMSDYRQRDSLFDDIDDLYVVDLDDLSLLKRFEYWQDQFNNRWNDWVLDYDRKTQKKLFSNFGFSSINSQQMVIVMIVLVVCFVLLTSVKWFHQRRKVEPLVKAYLSVLRRLDKKNVIEFDPTLGPLDLKKRLTQKGVVRYQYLNLLLDEYIRLRYREASPSQNELKSLVKSFNNLAIKKTKA